MRTSPWIAALLVFTVGLGPFARAEDPPDVLPHVLVHFGVKTSAYEVDDSGRILDGTAVRERYRTLLKRLDAFATHYIEAYRLLHPNVRKVVSIGSGMYNIIYDTLEESEVVLAAFPRGCADLLADTPFEVSVMRNDLSWSAI